MQNLQYGNVYLTKVKYEYIIGNKLRFTHVNRS